MYKDPFRGGHNIMVGASIEDIYQQMQSQVMCEAYKYNKEPTETNNRKACNEVRSSSKKFSQNCKQNFLLQTAANNSPGKGKSETKALEIRTL